jgi:hypothetical protein
MRINHEGLALVIDGTNRYIFRYLEVHDKIKFLHFFLHFKQPQPNYPHNPISEHQLQRMLKVISFKEKINLNHKGDVLS